MKITASRLTSRTWYQALIRGWYSLCAVPVTVACDHCTNVEEGPELPGSQHKRSICALLPRPLPLGMLQTPKCALWIKTFFRHNGAAGRVALLMASCLWFWIPSPEPCWVHLLSCIPCWISFFSVHERGASRTKLAVVTIWITMVFNFLSFIKKQNSEGCF